MKKKFLAILLSAALAGTSLTGCGNAAEEDEWFAAEEDEAEEDENDGDPGREETGGGSAGEGSEREDAEEGGVWLLARSVCAEVENGECDILSEYEYEYDDHGNVVKMSRYRADDEAWWSDEQEFPYFIRTQLDSEEPAEEAAPAAEEPATPEEEVPTPVEEEAPAEEAAAKEVTAAWKPVTMSAKEMPAVEESTDHIPEISDEAERRIDSVTANETTFEFSYEYDDDGRMTKRTRYSMWADSADSIEKYLADEYVCVYDPDGNPIKEKVTRFFETWPETGEIPYDGEIHEIEEREYDADGREIKLREMYSRDDGNGMDVGTEYTYEYEYDGEGRVTEKIKQDQRLDEDGLKPDPFVWSYEYDEYGNLVRITARYIWDDGTESEDGGYAIAYEYDANGYLISESTYHATYGNREVHENTYDADGSLVRLVSDGRVVVENTYGANGNILKMVENRGEEEQTTEVNEYDTEGNIIRQEYMSSGVAPSVCEYWYDADGRIIKEAAEFSDGSRGLYEYEYDAHGNLIEEKRAGFSSGRVVITRYEYTKRRITDMADRPLEKELNEFLMPGVPSAEQPMDLSQYWKEYYVNEETLEILERRMRSAS